MNICQQCGGQIYEGEKFCPNCGKPVNVPMMAYGFQQMPFYGGLTIQQQVGYGFPQMAYGYPQFPMPVNEQRMRPNPELACAAPEEEIVEPEVVECEEAEAEETVAEEVIAEEVVAEEEVAEEVEAVEEEEIAPKKAVNGFSIAGIILAFCGFVSIGIASLFGIVFSIIGIANAKKYNGAGKALGIFGIIVAIIVIAAAVTLYVMYMNNVNALFEVILEQLKTFAA